MNTTDKQAQAAEPEDAEELNQQGVKHASGIDVPQDYKKAAEYYRRAAEQGHAQAQYNLGMLYRIGFGVTQDREQAIEWWRRSAEQGNAEARIELGFISFNNCDSYAEALNWWRPAAEQGNGFAQYLMARAYHKQWGVGPDLVEEYFWYSLAAKAGFESARIEKNVIAKRLTPEQMAEAETRIQQYTAKATKNDKSET